MGAPYHLRAGDAELWAIDDAIRPARTAAEMFPLADARLVDRHRTWLCDGLMDPATDRLILAYRSWLIRLPGLTILFDLANGEDKRRPGRPDLHRSKSGWLNALGRAGVSPDEVDLVIVSHLHTDHVGWLTRLERGEWRPTFPQARHLVTADELAFWSTRHRDFAWMGESFDDSVAPVLAAGLIDVVSPDHQLAPGLRLIPLPGHSPGMAGLQIDRGARCILAADVAHHPLQFREPGLSTVFCHDPAQAEATRRAFIARHADTGDLIVPIHFSRPAGRLVTRPDGGADFEFLSA